MRGTRPAIRSLHDKRSAIFSLSAWSAKLNLISGGSSNFLLSIINHVDLKVARFTIINYSSHCCRYTHVWDLWTDLLWRDSIDNLARRWFWRRCKKKRLCASRAQSVNVSKARPARTEPVVSLNTRCAYETLHFKCVPTRCVTTMVPTIKKPGYVYQLYIYVYATTGTNTSGVILQEKFLALFKLHEKS